MPLVSTKHPDLVKKLPEYELINDCIAGSTQVKFRKTKYLPIPGGELLDKDDEKSYNEIMGRYNAYLTRAVFYNVAERTLRGMVGQIFSRKPQTDIPTDLQAILPNIDGSGVSFEQQAKAAAGRALSVGRGGLLSDFTRTGGIVTAEQLATGAVRPTIRRYSEAEIINWAYIENGPNKRLALVVLEEPYFERKEIFTHVLRKRYRVLILNAGVYEQWMYSDDNVNPVKIEVKGSDGQPLTEIPFEFIGSEKNNADIDYSPLFPICDLNLAHYRNSADNEESTFIVGQPTPVLAGLTKDWVTNVLGGKVILGSRKAIPLPQGASADLLQPDPNTLAATGMEHKERQMVALGARLVEQNSTQRTATEASQEEASEKSQLATIADNTAQAYERAFVHLQKFTGTNGPVTIAFNTEFELQKLSPEERRQLISEWVANAITTDEMRANLRRGGVAYLDDKSFANQIGKDKDTFNIPGEGDDDGDNEDDATDDNTGAAA